MQKAKETASNIAASAKAGMDKTKAVVQEKVEKMTAHDPVEKDRATQRKEDTIAQAEINKQQTGEHNAAATAHTSTGVSGTGGTYTHSATGTHGHSAGVPGSGGTYTHSATGTHGHSTGVPVTGETFTHSATGVHGHSTGMHQMSALPGHGTGQTLGGHVVEGTVGSHPIGKATGTGGTAGHNTKAGVNPGTHPTGYGTGTGGTYS